MNTDRIIEPLSLWYDPVYKRLAASELGAGHTSGIVPTTDTQPYFGIPRTNEKHLIHRIIIEFWHADQSKIITTNVNYFKTDTHNHIHLTGNLMPAYKSVGAAIGDFLIFWKSKSDEKLFKAELIKHGSPQAASLGLGDAAGGKIMLSPPPRGTSQDAYVDEEAEGYEIASEVEEDLTQDDFPTTKRRGRAQQGARFITLRNKAKGDFVLKQQKHQCQADPSHKSFITPSGLPYMEKHHLISMKFYEEFENDLDDISNIVSLCPMCHRQIHLGRKEDVSKIIEILYEKQKDPLASSGFLLSLAEVKEKYGIS